VESDFEICLNYALVAAVAQSRLAALQAAYDQKYYAWHAWLQGKAPRPKDTERPEFYPDDYKILTAAARLMNADADTWWTMFRESES
jgi:hypothetical protein